MLHNHVGPDAGRGNVGVQLHGCSWYLYLHLERGFVFQLQQLSVTHLICSNSGIVEEGKRYSTDVSRECVRWGVVTAINEPDVRGKL